MNCIHSGEFIVIHYILLNEENQIIFSSVFALAFVFSFSKISRYTFLRTIL